MARSTDPVIGRLIDGRYRIEREIARGGMAGVYQARDERLDRICAVKIMHTGIGTDENFVTRFKREAKAAARMSHPNIVSVFDQGEDDGLLFLVMEYIPGQTLRDRIRSEAPLAPERALEYLHPVLAALAHAHAQRIIHRDVKPENVLITDDGDAKVVDFGLAKVMTSASAHTATNGVLIGTVSYLAPELVVTGRGDARCDVYSAGVMLYEMLTGRKPHEGESAIQVAYKHVNEDVPAPSALVGDVPDYVDALVARATTRDLDQRPQDAAALLTLTRRVQTALQAGEISDPDLVSDLLPRPPSDDLFPTEEMTALSVVDQDEEQYGDFDQYRDQPGQDGDDRTNVLPLAPAALGDDVIGMVARDLEREPEQIVPAPNQEKRRAVAMPAPLRQGRRGPAMLAGVVALALIAGLVGWYFGIGRYTDTPDLIDLTQTEAATVAEAEGLDVEVADEAYSETVAAGSVIETSPDPGDRILKDGVVELVVSLGPERHPVPQLRGVAEEQALAALEEATLTVDDIRRVYNERFAEDVVISVSPKPGTELRRGDAVNLVISRGPKPILIGDYVGKRAAGITSKLDSQGLEVEIEEEFSEDVAKGRVIAQSSPDGAVLYKGDTLTLTVSQGPPLVEVPNVVRQGVEAARQTLQAAGFDVEVRESGTYIGLGFVLSQTPGGGDEAPRGSTIVIFLV